MSLRPPPSFCITIELERAAPRVRVSSVRDTDYERLVLWLERRPELLDLLVRAIELEQEARAA